MFVPLTELLDGIETGKSFKCDERPPSAKEVGVVKVSAVSWGSYQEQESKTCIDGERVNPALFVQPGDFLFSRANTIELVGACVIAQQVSLHVMLSDKILRFRFASEGMKIWVLHLLRSEQGREQIEALASGNQDSMRNIGQARIGQIRVPLPPAAEQTRIVDKLEELLSDLDAGVAELKAAQKKFAQYRQSLLKAAVEGQLTQAWRAQHGEPEESGAQLLVRILRERRARWEAKQLAKFEAQGKAPLTGWKDKYLEPCTPAIEGLPSLPPGWTWASADQLTTECSYGTSVKCSYESSGVPVLRIPNVARREVDLSDLKFANEPLQFASPDHLAQGDILVVRTNGSIGLVGRAASIDAPLNGEFYFASYLLRLRSVERLVIPRWISAFLGSSAGRSWIEKRAASSAGQHNISLSTLLKLPIPLPPLAEQGQAIIALRAALEIGAGSESDVARALRQSTAQRKNILQAAFSGRLVPQDPADEPARVLLERIRAERAVQAAGVNRPARGRRRTAAA